MHVIYLHGELIGNLHIFPQAGAHFQCLYLAVSYRVFVLCCCLHIFGYMPFGGSLFSLWFSLSLQNTLFCGYYLAVNSFLSGGYVQWIVWCCDFY